MQNVSQVSLSAAKKNPALKKTLYKDESKSFSYTMRPFQFKSYHLMTRNQCINLQIKAVTSCSTHKIGQQETDRKNQNAAIQILGESLTNPSCLQKYFGN